MTQKNTNLYLADEGKTFHRKSDNFNMGTGIDLGVNDTIENYEEVEMTDEEKAEEQARMEAFMPQSTYNNENDTTTGDNA